MPASGPSRISRLGWTANSGIEFPVTADPSSGSVVWDEQAIPSLTASVVIPYDLDMYGSTDPTGGTARVRLAGRHEFTQSEPLSAITAEGYSTVADMSAAWSGLTLADVSALYGRPLTPGGELYPDDVLELDLLVVDRDRIRAGSDEFVSLRLVCDEQLAIDYLNVERRTIEAGTVRQLCTLVLAEIGAELEPDPVYDPGHAFYSDALLPEGFDTWDTGVSAWRVMQAACDIGGLLLRCDHERKWRLIRTDINTFPTEGVPINLSFLDGARFEQRTSRARDWYDAVAIEYVWIDGAGVEQRAVDTAQLNDPPQRVYYERRGTAYAPGAAAQILERTQRRGDIFQADAPPNLHARVGSNFTWQIDNDTPQDIGIISRVSWSITDDVMAISGRDF